MNLNEIFRKHVIYRNLKSHKNSWLELLSRKYNFEKTIGMEEGQTDPSVF